MSYPFKICDSVHGFVRFGDVEKQVIDSRPFQRLRYIHQMAVAYLVYPGATHTRFEHSLGVMELVTRIYNTLIAKHNQVVNIKKKEQELDYWRLILRLAALCHDMGHLPFSHTAEKTLLPHGGHESMTLKLIRSSELRDIWKTIGENAEKDIANLSVNVTDTSLPAWEKVLSKIITEDSFGADRIDYLIRDSHYTGVGYGHFDYHQLIDCLRILPDQNALNLGVTASGIQSVESLWIARYMMYARVYQHPKAKVFSNHLNRFMCRTYLKEFPMNIEDYLEQTDYILLTTLSQAAKAGDYDAQCLLKQKQPYCEIPKGVISNCIKQKLNENFGEQIFLDEFPQKEIRCAFPVYLENGQIVSCDEASSFLNDIPLGGKSFSLYVDPEKKESVEKFLSNFSE